MNGQVPISSLRLYMSVNCSTFAKNSSLPFSWQQFVDLVFQDDLIKCKQNFDVIMDDTFIHLTAEEHIDDLMDI